MDPPSYGRGPSGEVWKLEDNLYPFLELVVQVLSDQPLFIIINSYTTGLAPSVLGYLLDTLVTKQRGGHTECQELGLPVTASGLAACGATGRWMAGNQKRVRILCRNRLSKPNISPFAYTAEGGSPLVLDGVDLEIEDGQLCGGAGPQRLRQVHPGQALQRHPAPQRGKVYVAGMDTGRRRKSAGHPPHRGHGVPESGQPDCSRQRWRRTWPSPRRTWGVPPGGDPPPGGRRPGGGGDVGIPRGMPPICSPGGQKQRVAIAGVIAMAPCIVLDEPTAMLDPIGPGEVLRTIRPQPGERRHSGPHHPPYGRGRPGRQAGGHGPGQVMSPTAPPREVFQRVEACGGGPLPSRSRWSCSRSCARRRGRSPLGRPRADARKCAGPVPRHFAVRTGVPAGMHHFIKDWAPLEPIIQTEKLCPIPIRHRYAPSSITPWWRWIFTAYPGRTWGSSAIPVPEKSTPDPAPERPAEAHRRQVLFEGAGYLGRPRKPGQTRFQVGLVFQYPEYQLFEGNCLQGHRLRPQEYEAGRAGDRPAGPLRHRLRGPAGERAPAVPFELSGGQKRRVAIAGVHGYGA